MSYGQTISCSPGASLNLELDCSGFELLIEVVGSRSIFPPWELPLVEN